MDTYNNPESIPFWFIKSCFNTRKLVKSSEWLHLQMLRDVYHTDKQVNKKLR